MSDTGRSVQEEGSDLDLVRAALADEYEVLDEIGRGGMAVVFRARDRALDRDVAIKMLPISMSFDNDFVERFQREARMSAQLEHPNIVPIYRVGRAGRVIYFVMKYVRGASLGTVLSQRHTLPPEEIREVLRDTAHALAYAGRRGVVHRDIKPDNILYDEDRWVLADFGIAKSASAPSLTQSGAAVGTPHYMSPEQARARPIDGRADIYSLGILAYQCLTGRVPFDGDDGFAILYDHVTTPLPTPALPNDDARALFTVIARMVEKDPNDRVADGDALLTLLDVAPRLTPALGISAIGLGAVPSSVHTLARVPTLIVTAPTGLSAVTGPRLPLPVPEPPPPPQPRRRRRWPWAAAAIVLAAAGAGAYGIRHRQPPPVPAVVPTPIPTPPPTAVVTPAPVPAAPPPPSPAAAAPSAATVAKCGTNASAFKLVMDPVSDHARDMPLEVSYDVCGLANGAVIRSLIVVRRRQTTLGKLLGTSGPISLHVEDHSAGRLTRLHHKMVIPRFKPGDYSLYIAITDRRGRRREQVESFQVLP